MTRDVEHTNRLARLYDDLPGMVADLDALVSVESPSNDPACCGEACDVLEAIVCSRLGARAERIELEGRRHLRWRFGSSGRRGLLLLGHLDTVWPLGTLAGWPFSVSGDVATGPGCFDMKAGLVQGICALGSMRRLDGVTLLVTSDEEIGSPSSRLLIEQAAREAAAVLVLEPALGEAVKTSRKGVLLARIAVTGRAAHAGLEPEKGANAILELAAQTGRIADLARPGLGTTVVPSTVSGGSASNVVPAHAELTVDVRATDRLELSRVEQALYRLRVSLPDTHVECRVESSRPPFEARSSSALYDVARQVWRDLGMGELAGAAAGGASDGNLTAAIGIPTLDGLGAVGSGAHARDEHVRLDLMPARAALLAGLVEELTAQAGEGARI